MKKIGAGCGEVTGTGMFSTDIGRFGRLGFGLGPCWGCRCGLFVHVLKMVGVWLFYLLLMGLVAWLDWMNGLILVLV